MPELHRRKPDHELDESFASCPKYEDYIVADKRLEDILTRIEHLYTAFPNGDVVGHQAYHSAKIRAAVAEEAFWQDLKLDIAKKGAWGMLLIIVGLIIVGLSVKVGAYKP